MDAREGADERYSKAPARHKAAVWDVPSAGSAREIEGMGGRFFYEGA